MTANIHDYQDIQSDDGIDMAYPEPPTSKTQIRIAGEKISKGIHQNEDIVILDQWRGAHAYVLNTFQALLRNRIKSFDGHVEFVQRLKRRKTVIDKLTNQRGVNLASMNDIAGCRLIFDSIDELNEFRLRLLHSARIRHKLKYEDADKYNYILEPKETGYRGIHDVYRHRPRDNRNSPWEDLLIEIQYRTQYQNSWATAVEIADIINKTRVKFEENNTDQSEFFAVCSEIVARKENRRSTYNSLAEAELMQRFNQLESKTGLLGVLKAIKTVQITDSEIGKHNVLAIFDNGGFEIEKYSSGLLALKRANYLEDQENTVNVVYVSSESPRSIRASYKNYFNDPLDFVGLIQQPPSTPPN